MLIKDLMNYFIKNRLLLDGRLKDISRFSSMSKIEMKEIQIRLLDKSLRLTAENIPAYLSYESDYLSLERFPVLQKSDILKNQKQYQSSLFYKKYVSSIGKTSGTTGTPLSVYRSINSILWENAFVQDHWGWSGFRRGMPWATLRGNLVLDNVDGRNWRFNALENQLVLSSRHLFFPYIEALADKLNDFSPYILQAYPSTAYEMAKYVDSKGGRLHIPFVYTGSEMIYPHQRSLIERVFNCKVMDFYGMAERVAFAAQCEHGSYHIHPLYSHVEILDDEDNPTSEEGFVVGTTLHNSIMPLIRYRLSDRTKWKSGTCECGRCLPMIEPISGKYEDVVYGSGGNPISPSIITFAFKDLMFVERSQVAQIADCKWEIRVVPKPGFDNREKTKLLNNIRNLVDPGLDIKIVVCDDIPRTGAYKYRWIVNETK